MPKVACHLERPSLFSFFLPPTFILQKVPPGPKDTTLLYSIMANLNNSSASHFPRFLKLPAELQIKIWKYARPYLGLSKLNAVHTGNVSRITETHMAKYMKYLGFRIRSLDASRTARHRPCYTSANFLDTQHQSSTNRHSKDDCLIIRISTLPKTSYF